MFEKAQEYIEAGLSIHLLTPFQNSPISKDWVKEPRLTSRGLFEELKETPDANIGVRLGESSKIDNHYLYVLYLEINSEEPLQIQQAYGKLKEIYKDYNKLPCVYNDGKNNRYFYFLSKVLLKTKKLAYSSDKCIKMVNGEQKQKNNWDIDLLSTGRQVVLPPSEYNGYKYKWEINLLDYLNDENKKALMIIDDISLIGLNINDYKKEEPKTYSIVEVKKYLEKLPEEWFNNNESLVKVGMALHYQFADTDDEQEVIALYDDFHKKSEKYEKGSSLKKWKLFNKEHAVITLNEIFSKIPKETAQDRLNNFVKFLNEEKVTFDTLREKLSDVDLKDYELDSYMDLIAEALAKTYGGKPNVVSARKTVKSLKKEIEEIKALEFEKLAIGLDDTLATIILKEKFNEGKHLLNLNDNLFFYRKGLWVNLEESVLQKTVLEGIKNIFYSKDEKYDAIKNVIYKKKMNDNLNGLTNQISSIILKMIATPESDDILNLQNKSDVRYSVINTLNKELYIQDGKITVQDHKYDSYLITQYNVAYDPNAKAPTWNLMLNNIFRNYPDKEEVIRHFKEVFGSIIQKRKKEAFFVLLLGGGRNGKSFLMNEFMKIMGVDSSLSVDITECEKDKHFSAYAVGKNMLYTDEYPKKALLPDATIKKYSEGKIITANPKFGKPFNYVSIGTPVISSNHSIKTADTSFGLERRAQVFDFNHQIAESEIDHKLDQKLSQERSGFLNELLEAYINYQNRGHFKVPLSCQKSLKNWLKGSNPLLSFLSDKVVVTKDATDTVKAQGLYDKYKKYVELENNSHQLTRNNFYEDLNGINGISVKINSSDKNYYVHGLRLIN